MAQAEGMQRARRDGFLVAAGLVELEELSPRAVAALEYLAADERTSHYDGFVELILVARGRRGDLTLPAPPNIDRHAPDNGVDYRGMGRTKVRHLRPQPGNSGP